MCNARVNAWQPHSFRQGVRGHTIKKSCFYGGVRSGKLSSFWQCGACSRWRSSWTAAEFFFFNAFEIHVSPFKKQLCPLFCNFIDFDFYFFNYYLFCFLKFSFSSISFILLPKNNLYLSSFFLRNVFFSQIHHLTFDY